MSTTTRGLAITAVFVAGTAGAIHWVRQRRRHLALKPITIATRANMTFWQSRRKATLRNRALAYDGTP